jgi:DNA-binding protein Fis
MPMTGNTKEGETSRLVDEYSPNFVGAYKSTQGISINVYVAEIEGQETTGQYEMHPETLQYILDNIEFFIPYAPENESKDSIIKHLEQLESGEIDGVLQLVLHSGTEATCLDAQMQIIKYLQEDCRAGGVTQVAGFSSWERRKVIALWSVYVELSKR